MNEDPPPALTRPLRALVVILVVALNVVVWSVVITVAMMMLSGP
jgi:hypothetical protein